MPDRMERQKPTSQTTWLKAWAGSQTRIRWALTRGASLLGRNINLLVRQETYTHFENGGLGPQIRI